MAAVKIRRAYDVRDRQAIVFHDDDGMHDGRTEQHHKDMCDIHCIIQKYDKTGLIQHVNASQAMYGDFTEVNEYQEALNTVIRGQEAFDGLPAHLRKHFDNDPGKFLEFVSNPDNQEKMIELGIAQRMVEPEPQKVHVVNQQDSGEPDGKPAGSQAPE